MTRRARSRAVVAISALALASCAACGAFGADSEPDAPGDAAANDAATTEGATTDSPAGPLGASTKLAEENGVYGIAVDDSTVYWSNPILKHVRAIAKPGKTTNIPDPVLQNLPEVRELQVDSTDVFIGLSTCMFMTGAYPLKRWNKGTKTSTEMITGCGAGGLVRLAASGDYLLVRLQGGNTTEVSTVSKGGGGVAHRLGSSPVGPIALFGGHAYWTFGGAIESRELDGGVFASGTPVDLAADAENLYWVDGNGTVFRSRHDAPPGSPGTEVAKDPGTALRMAVFKGFVYWTNESAGRVLMAPVQGGSVSVIATDQAKPFAIAVDDDGVYWTNRGDGTIQTAKRL